MTTTWKAVSAFSALGVAVLLVQDGIAIFGKHINALQYILTSTAPQSPVRIVGGSITVRAPGQWSPADSTKPNNPPFTTAGKVTNETDDISLENFRAEKKHDPLGWSDIDVPWEIDAYPTDQNGAPQRHEGLSLCTNPVQNSGATNCDTPKATMLPTVTVVPVKNASASGFYGRKLLNQFPNLYGEEGLRFHENGCNLANGDFCEHLGEIGVTIQGEGSTHYYMCPDGQCQVIISASR